MCIPVCSAFPSLSNLRSTAYARSTSAHAPKMLLVAPPLTWLAARSAARAASPCCCVDPRSLRPPLDYTSQFAKDSGPIEVTPIGWISSPYKERFGTPRQPTVDEQVSGGKLQEGEIVLAPDVSTLALRGLAGFEYCCTPHGARTPDEQADTFARPEHQAGALVVLLLKPAGPALPWTGVICYMHLNTGWRPLITPPRGPKKKQAYSGLYTKRPLYRAIQRSRIASYTALYPI